MKIDKYFLFTGSFVGSLLLINLFSLISIMKDAIHTKDHIFLLGDLLLGKMNNEVALELTLNKTSAWRTIDTIITSQWISVISIVIYWVIFLVLVYRRSVLKKQ